MTDQREQQKLIGWLIFKTWTLSMCGSPTKEQKETFERAGAPQPGDYVVEMTSLWRNSPPNACGRLIMTRRERLDEGDWLQEPESERPSYEFVYIETLEGQLARWTNCKFLAAVVEVTNPAADKAWADEARKRHGLEP